WCGDSHAQALDVRLSEGSDHVPHGSQILGQFGEAVPLGISEPVEEAASLRFRSRAAAKWAEIDQRIAAVAFPRDVIFVEPRIELDGIPWVLGHARQEATLTFVFLARSWHGVSLR